MSQKLCLRLMPILLLILVSCGGSDNNSDSKDDVAKAVPPTSTPIYTVISHPSLQQGDEIPAPGDEVVLTVTGKIGASNVAGATDNTVQFNLIRLEALGVVEYQAFDEFGTGTDTIFQGILLESLLTTVGFQQGVTELEIIASDGFSVVIPLSDAFDYPTILAIKADGEYLTRSQHGPVRLVYPYGYFDLDPTVYNVRWVWNIDQIVVR